MADKLCSSSIMIHKIAPYLDYNKWFKTLDTHQLNKIQKKAPKFLSQRIKNVTFRLWKLV